MLKLNTTRTFPKDVTVPYFDEDGKKQKGKFTAIYKVVPTDELESEENKDKRLLDVVLHGVENLQLTDEDGRVLEGEELLRAAKLDPEIGGAMVITYREVVGKKG